MLILDYFHDGKRASLRVKSWADVQHHASVIPPDVHLVVWNDRGKHTTLFMFRVPNDDGVPVWKSPQLVTMTLPLGERRALTAVIAEAELPDPARLLNVLKSCVVNDVEWDFDEEEAVLKIPNDKMWEVKAILNHPRVVKSFTKDMP